MSGFRYTKALLIGYLTVNLVKKWSKPKKKRKNVVKILASPMKSKSSTPRE